jgi:hypothetical protein
MRDTNKTIDIERLCKIDDIWDFLVRTQNKDSESNSRVMPTANGLFVSC